MGMKCSNMYDFIIIEDKRMIRMILVKSGREASNCWSSLLEGKYICDPMTFDQMEKKLTLERFQREVRVGGANAN